MEVLNDKHFDNFVLEFRVRWTIFWCLWICKYVRTSSSVL